RLRGLVPNAVLRQAVAFCQRDADGQADVQEMLRAKRTVTDWKTSLETRAGDSQPTIAEWTASQAVGLLTHYEVMRRGVLAREVARHVRRAVHEAANDRRAILEASAAEVIQVARVTWQA